MAGAAPAANTPPGWYPAGDGTQRYWDGTTWTNHSAPAAAGHSPALGGALTNDERTMAMLSHLLGLFTGFIGPLVIYLIKKDESAYVRQQSAEALNFQITVFIAYMVSFVLMLILIGFLLFFVVLIASLILMIMAAMAANRGENYRYPVNIRMIN